MIPTMTASAGTTASSAIKQRSVKLPDRNQDTPQPTASGNEDCWPTTQLPAFSGR